MRSRIPVVMVMMSMLVHVEGKSVIEVHPNPGIVYRLADPGVPVLAVNAYDDVTGDAIPDVALTTTSGALYFELVQNPRNPKEHALNVKKRIDKDIGHVFSFNVYSTYGDFPQEVIKVNVTERNMFAPVFEQGNYTILAYRLGWDANITDVGTVHATDSDVENYNKAFQYYITHHIASQYVGVDPETGMVMLIDNLPPGLTNLTFKIMAIDSGSPQQMGATDVVLEITNVKPPDVFCVSVDVDSARVCWKDPTNGSYVMKYELLLKVDNETPTKRPVEVRGVADETCTIIDGDQLGKNYTFNVRVLKGLEWSPQSIQRKVTITKPGLYGNECRQFSNCSILEPCKNGGECLVNPDNSYTCNCSEGWGGVNCTEVDPCEDDTCQNGGKCVFDGDGNYTCECPSNYFGSCDESLVTCSPSPCRRGTCSQLVDGSINCTCPVGYEGQYCELENSCELYKPCHKGQCLFLGHNILTRTLGNFECKCDQGYKGRLCDILDVCEWSALDNLNICKNNGTCLFLKNLTHECFCQPGYWGKTCEFYDPCSGSPCLNGRCENISDSDFRCNCHGGHFGATCEHYNPCYDRPCKFENSTCHNISDTEFECHCKDGVSIRNCSTSFTLGGGGISTTNCTQNGCKNGGTCIESMGFCQCPYGFKGGDYCEDIGSDPCSSSPCQNNGTCSNMTSGDLIFPFSCKCPNGFRGDTCELVDPCADKPCWNNGTCNAGHGMNYICTCNKDFYGTQCENINFCNIVDCPNNSTCVIEEGMDQYSMMLKFSDGTSREITATNSYSCVCNNGLSGRNCQFASTCVDDPCGEGQCVPKGQGHMCKCPDSTTRLNCNPAYCPEDHSFYDKTGRYVWPRVTVGGEARAECHHGARSAGSGYAVRKCSVTLYGESYWETPYTKDCFELSEEEVSNNLRKLMSGTRDARGLHSEEIANITSMLEEFFAFSLTNHEIATEMTMVVGNLLDANESMIIESNSRNHSSERLLWLLDEYVSKVNTSTNVSIETENINLQVVNHSTPDTGFLYRPALKVNNAKEEGSVTLELPPEALTSPTSSTNQRIQLMTFRSSSLFIPADAPPPPQEVLLKQWVVTAEVKGKNVTELSDPVEIDIQNIKEGANHSCVFWDPKTSSWSTYGMVTEEQTNGRTKCLSYHLTSFAILLDPNSGQSISEEHERVLTYISYIGCGISMLGLTLTLITYSLFRCLNREKSGKILMNLCASMLILNIVFVVGSETSLAVSGDVMCRVVAILLHYFLLTTLTWMLVEAINMYQALITVFAKYSGFFMLKRCLFAWGVPAIIVIITVSVNVDNYKTTTELCFLSQGNQVAFFSSLLGPACLILLINTAVFIMVSRVILKPRFKGQVGSNNDSINPAQIRGAFTVMTLLGVTWVFGPFAINEAKLTVNYIFTILNSLQGFLIFIFRCCFNPEVRTSWILLIKTGKFKRRKGPVTFTSETSSSKGDSKVNGSHNTDTLKSNLYYNAKINRDTFTDLHKHKGGRGVNTVDNGGLYNERDHRDTNGHVHRSPGGRYNGGVTTIYTGRENGVRRLSGFVADKDELTRL